MALPGPEPVPDIGSPSAGRNDHFPDDRFLRSQGWQIHRRPRRGCALWRRDGVVLPVESALEMAREGRKP